MPSSNPLSHLFGKSPIRPLQVHMDTVVTCVELLPIFLEAVFSSDWQKAELLYDSIKKGENKADDLKKQLRLQLPKSLFMPVDRRDLLELLSKQDHIADHIKDIAGIMLGRKMVFPQSLEQSMIDFVASAVSTTKQAQKAINELDELLEAGFMGREVTFVEGIIAKLGSLEGDSDAIEMNIRHQLFTLESELKPVDVMFLYQVIDDIGAVSDHAEDVGDRLHQMLAR